MLTVGSVSVVIPTWNEAHSIGMQLAALSRQQLPVPTEILVADNGSTDRTRAIVAEQARYDDRLRLIDASEISGPSFARQRGTDEARGDLLLFCDADDVVGGGWMQEHLRAASHAHAIGGHLSHEVLNVPHVRRWRAGSEMRELPTALDFLPYAYSSNLAVRREVMDAVGGWDTTMGHGEDVDLSWRIQLAGYDLAYAPQAVVHYRHRDTPRALWRQLVGYGEGDVLLLQRYRRHGARRPSTRQVARRALYITTRLPYLALGPARQGSWVTVAGPTWGRVRGSVRHRVLCV
jgi:GT2 family glycosyltransferase